MPRGNDPCCLVHFLGRNGSGKDKKEKRFRGERWFKRNLFFSEERRYSRRSPHGKREWILPLKQSAQACKRKRDRGGTSGEKLCPSKTRTLWLLTSHNVEKQTCLSEEGSAQLSSEAIQSALKCQRELVERKHGLALECVLQLTRGCSCESDLLLFYSSQLFQ